MRQWIEWTRTGLQPQEREELLAALTSEQKVHLLEHDYVWVEGVGVLWSPPHGDPLRRALFTHGTRFQTERGEFYIDSAGSAREISDHRIDSREPTPGSSGEWVVHRTQRRLEQTPGALQQVLRHRDSARG